MKKKGKRIEQLVDPNELKKQVSILLYICGLLTTILAVIIIRQI